MLGSRAPVAPSLPRPSPAPRPLPPAATRDGERQHLTLLGGFRLHAGDDPVPIAPGPQRLVALLALHDTALRRDRVAGMLWGDSTEARAHGSLRSTLWKLQGARPGVVWIQGDNLELADSVEVDLRHVSRLARSLVTGRFDEETIGALLEPRFCCELLPGWFDEWVLVERERHRQMCLHALESLCEHLTGAGRYGAAVLAGLAAVGMEPLRESAHRALIRVHLAEGNAGEAIRRYRLYEGIAARDLGVGPSPMMRSLLRGIATV
ncbi:MAG TPA: BTAD domain-containing putative transcriptional regulator [Streptosporangiaceae bacterium]|nr:BTAD domain-containing putative transcriptional regulator [Streptosporangiaceae bacterium]